MTGWAALRSSSLERSSTPLEVHLPSKASPSVVQLLSRETSCRARSLAGRLWSTLVEQTAAAPAARGEAMEVPLMRA